MNLKKAKALRKALKLMPEFTSASAAHLAEYLATNVKEIPMIPPEKGTIKTFTLHVPKNTKRGIYLSYKLKVKK